MTDAYYPEFDSGIMTSAARTAPHDAARAAEADKRRAFAPLVPDTRRARYAVLANHCAQARAGYFYCEGTPADPCGYSAERRYPHDGCTPAECKAPHTCDDLAAYSTATTPQAVPVIDRTDGRGIDHACSGSWHRAGHNAAGHDVYACDSGRHLLIDQHRSADHQCLTVLDCLSPVVSVTP